MPNGPGIDCGDRLLAEMIQDSLLARETQQVGPYTEDVFTIPSESERPISLDKDELEAIKSAVKWVKDKTASKLTEITHEHSKGWNMGEDGDIIDPYIDGLSDEEFNSIKQHQKDASNLIDSVFGD